MGHVCYGSGKMTRVSAFVPCESAVFGSLSFFMRRFVVVFSFLTVADWSTKTIKNRREPEQLIHTVI